MRHFAHANECGVYMARPQQSPRMRDHWRDEVDREEVTSRSGRPRERSSGRRRSPAPSERRERERSVELDVKIRGRASVEDSYRIPSHKRHTSKDRHRDPHPRRRASQSTQRRKPREGSYDGHEQLSEENHYQRRQYRGKQRSHLDFQGRRRSRTRSPHRAPHSYKDRERSPDPYHPRHIDRLPQSRARYRETYSSRPASPSGADHYKSGREDNPSTVGDFYIPSARRRRSRSPVVKDYRDTASSRNRRSPSSTSHHRQDVRSSYAEDDLFYYRGSREKETVPATSHQARASSQSRQSKTSHTKVSRDRSRGRSDRPKKKPRLTQSPPANEQINSDRKMQSTHRIEVLDSTSRPQSQHRPIPSFESSANTPSAYPMHHTNRPSPLQVNTQYPHSTSPQWTPTTSHHGSPQSASPYNHHGRGAWSGQPQQYHGQQGQVPSRDTTFI